MAQVMGFQMKNVKNILGREGYGCSATLYLNGKKIGSYVDYGDGAPEDVEFVSKDAEKEMMKLIIEFAKTHHNDFIVNLYKERPQQYQEECERFRKYYPYIPEEDITIETMASNSIVYIVDEFLRLYDLEKEFKKYQKKGYGAIGVTGHQITAFPAGWSKEKIMEHKCEKYYFSLNDFVA